MATTIKTVMTYPLDGSTTDFNIPFEYLARKFVRVTLIGVDRKELILNQDYRFATKTTISTTRALGPADGYTLIEIRRFTSATDRLVDFTDGSILRAYDLNISQVQTLHVAEEARDLTADTIGVNNDGNLDARGRRIVNVADAQDVGDAINLGQIQRWNDSALNSANRARAESDRATARASEAATYAGNSASSASLSRDWAIKESPVEGTFKSSRSYALDAMAYRDVSKSYADAGAASAGAAQTSEINAKNSEIAAKTSETNAKTSETNAKASEERAITEASKLGNMNDLAGAIKEVLKPEGATSGKVVWKYDIDSKVLRAYNGMSLGLEWDGTDSPFMNFYRGQGEPSGSLRLDANKVVRFSGMNSVDFDSTINAQRNLTVIGVSYLQGDIKQTASAGVYNSLHRAHFRSKPLYVSGNQGLHIAWNEGGDGASNFITNRGAGDGGFVFRTVDVSNSVETGKVNITGDGVLYAKHLQVRSGARIEGNNNIVGQNLYAGMGNVSLGSDGNLSGGVWGGVGGSLWSCLNDRYQFAKPPAGVRLYTARGGDYLEGNVDGGSVGFRWFNSDRRLKENLKVVRSADDMLNIIRSYIPVSYKYKDSEYVDNRGKTVTVTGKNSRAGFITQDLIRIWPEAVDIMSDGMQSPDPNQIIGGLMLLVKNLDARVQELESKLMTD